MGHDWTLLTLLTLLTYLGQVGCLSASGWRGWGARAGLQQVRSGCDGHHSNLNERVAKIVVLEVFHVSVNLVLAEMLDTDSHNTRPAAG